MKKDDGSGRYQFTVKWQNDSVESCLGPAELTVIRTVMVPQTSYQARQVQVPQVQQVRVPRQVMEQQVSYIQVPKMEVQEHKVPTQKTIMVPQVVEETYTYQTQRPVYTTKYRTVQVPKMIYEPVEVPYQEQEFEMKEQTYQVPRMTEEIQNVTNYVTQTVQEPVVNMVPQTQTVNTVQQINKVVEYARTPVNQYTVPGPSYTMPAQQTYTMPAQQTYAMPATTGYTMPATTGYAMPATTGYTMPTTSYGGYGGYPGYPTGGIY